MPNTTSPTEQLETALGGASRAAKELTTAAKALSRTDGKKSRKKAAKKARAARRAFELSVALVEGASKLTQTSAQSPSSQTSAGALSARAGLNTSLGVLVIGQPVSSATVVNVTDFAEAKALAEQMVGPPSRPSAGDNLAYFQAQSQMALAPLLLSASLSGATFGDLWNWSLVLDSEAEALKEGADHKDAPFVAKVTAPLLAYASMSGDQSPVDYMNQVLAKETTEAAGIWGTLRKHLQVYAD